MFGLDSDANPMTNSTRRGSLYESRIWGTGLSPPLKPYSLDVPMLNAVPDSEAVNSQPLYSPQSLNAIAGLGGGLEYVKGQLQGFQQFGNGFDAGQRNADHRRSFQSQIDDHEHEHAPDFLGLSRQHAPPAASVDKTFDVYPVNSNLSYHGFRGRTFSDASSLQSPSMHPPSTLSSPLTAIAAGQQTSPVPAKTAFKLSPTQNQYGTASSFSPSSEGQFNAGLPIDDRHFTYKPPNFGGMLNAPGFAPPAPNVSQYLGTHRNTGRIVTPTDEQLRYTNNFSTGWNQVMPNENVIQVQDEDGSVGAFRRYSQGDAYRSSLVQPLKQYSPQKQFNSQLAGQRCSIGGVEHLSGPAYDDGGLEAVEKYFTVDVHQRVKVSAEFFFLRYEDEKEYLQELYQLPQFPPDSSTRNLRLVLVCFKAGRLDVFYMPEKSNLKFIKENDLVIVEADRGRDLGKVVKLNISFDEARLLKLLQFLEQLVALSEKSTENITLASLHHGSVNSRGGGEGVYFAPPTLYCPKPIISLALRAEILLITSKSLDEEKACRLSLAKIASTLNLINAGEAKGTLTLADLSQMRLVDAEYQFDRRKLIFYYSTSKRIDFRDLVRELFRIYKTRIWMCAVTGIPYQQSVKKGGQQKTLCKQEERKSTGTIGFTERKAGSAAVKHNYFTVDSTTPVNYETPRKFHGTRTILEEESFSRSGSGESLVLKSLVDTLNN